MKLLPEWATIRIDTDAENVESMLELSLMPNVDEGLLFSIKFECLDLRGHEGGFDPEMGLNRHNGIIEELPMSVAIQMRDFLNYALRNVK